MIARKYMLKHATDDSERLLHSKNKGQPFLICVVKIDKKANEKQELNTNDGKYLYTSIWWLTV